MGFLPLPDDFVATEDVDVDEDEVEVEDEEMASLFANLMASSMDP